MYTMKSDIKIFKPIGKAPKKYSKGVKRKNGRNETKQVNNLIKKMIKSASTHETQTDKTIYNLYQ